MSHDPIVDEIREHRENYAKKFDFDFKSICDDLKRQQSYSDHEIVSLSPKVFVPEQPQTTEQNQYSS